MSPAHGPNWAVFVNHASPDSAEFGACFYPVVDHAIEFTEDGEKVIHISFTAKPDANNWCSEVQLNGASLIHQPGYEMVLAALRKICEAPA